MPRGRLPGFRRRIGVVFQDFRLVPHLSTFDNVALPLRVAGVEDKDLETPVREMLAWVGLADRASARPGDPVGRRAAARRHRPRGDRPARIAGRRRADRQCRSGDGEAAAPSVRFPQQARHDGDRRDPRSASARPRSSAPRCCGSTAARSPIRPARCAIRRAGSRGVKGGRAQVRRGRARPAARGADRRADALGDRDHDVPDRARRRRRPRPRRRRRAARRADRQPGHGPDRRGQSRSREAQAQARAVRRSTTCRAWSRSGRCPTTEIAALLEPWLGAGGLESDLPVPALIDVDLTPEAHAGARPAAGGGRRGRAGGAGRRQRRSGWRRSPR